MFEERRRCAGCNKVVGWTEKSCNTKDGWFLCVPCLERANLQQREHWDIQYCNNLGIKFDRTIDFTSSEIVERIKTHKLYDAFRANPNTLALLEGRLLINKDQKQFAVGCDNIQQELIGYRSARYDNIQSITINDGFQTKSVKVSDGDSGAAGAVMGGLMFGTIGALAGGLATRTDAEYRDVVQTDRIGFTITTTIGAHEDFNVLELCYNRNSVDYNKDRALYSAAQKLTVQICEELYKLIEKPTQKQAAPSMVTKAVEQPDQVVTEPVTSHININAQNVEPTITRIQLFLEDEEWDKAKAYIEAALDYFPTDYRLYILMLCLDMKVSSLEELKSCSTSFRDNKNYKKALRFADEDMKNDLERACAAVEEQANRKKGDTQILAETQREDRGNATSISEQALNSEYICTVCGYTYRPSVYGEVRFETLPADWKCPICSAAKSNFKPWNNG